MIQKTLSFLLRQWRELRSVIIFVVFVVAPLKSSIADWSWVPTGSMNPTIVEGDMIFVNKVAYDLRFPVTLQRLFKWADPERGNIVVLFSPEDNVRMVKRVVGLPGDELEMSNNVLRVNGQKLSYSTLPPQAFADMTGTLKDRAVFVQEHLGPRNHAVMALPQIPFSKRSFAKIRIPEGQYFVMGDNRDMSKDSRFFGVVDRRLIVGEATAVILSFDKLDKFQPKLGRCFTALR